MAEDKKILLYRIDEQTKNVIFVVTMNNENEWLTISDNTETILSYDELFRDITEFRSSFLDYEKLTDELIESINGRGNTFRNMMKCFDDNYLNSFNFFTRYYSDILRRIFMSARKDIDKAGAFFNTKALKKSTEYVNSIFNHIREVMRDDWNFDFNSECDLQAFKLSFDKVIIRGNDYNEIYTVADTALVNFFYDFSFAIHNRKLYVCKCKFCGNQFLGMKNAVCCDNAECQEKYQRETKNAKRRERENSTYKVYITRLSNYIGQQKTKLPDEILDNPELVKMFDEQRKIFSAKMHEKISEYEIENRLPDKSLDDFYEKMKQDVVRFVYVLKENMNK